MRILLIEDDCLIGDGIYVGLKKMGFAVDWFKDGMTGKEALRSAPYDAVILDLGLPDIHGLKILRSWRDAGHNEPVIILTAQSDIEHKIIGLDSGADDYLGKPFSLDEVVARIKAVVRRHKNEAQSLIKHGYLSFDMNTKNVVFHGKQIGLSPKELILLEILLLNKNRVLSKSFIEEKLYSWNDEVQSNAIEVHIHNLRHKLDRSIIKTINKTGYILA